MSLFSLLLVRDWPGVSVVRVVGSSSDVCPPQSVCVPQLGVPPMLDTVTPLHVDVNSAECVRHACTVVHVGSLESGRTLFSACFSGREGLEKNDLGS